MAANPVQADSPAFNRAALTDRLLALRMNGTTPFTTHADGVDDCLRGARALVMVIESAFRTAHDARNNPKIDTIVTLNPAIVADALEGVTALLALAQHHHDAQLEARGA